MVGILSTTCNTACTQKGCHINIICDNTGIGGRRKGRERGDKNQDGKRVKGREVKGKGREELGR